LNRALNDYFCTVVATEDVVALDIGVVDDVGLVGDVGLIVGDVGLVVGDVGVVVDEVVVTVALEGVVKSGEAVISGLLTAALADPCFPFCFGWSPCIIPRSSAARRFEGRLRCW